MKQLLYKKCLKWCSKDKTNIAGLQIDKSQQQRVTVNELMNQLTFLMTPVLGMILFFLLIQTIVFTIQKSIVFTSLIKLSPGVRLSKTEIQMRPAKY